MTMFRQWKCQMIPCLDDFVFAQCVTRREADSLFQFEPARSWGNGRPMATGPSKTASCRRMAMPLRPVTPTVIKGICVVANGTPGRIADPLRPKRPGVLSPDGALPGGGRHDWNWLQHQTPPTPPAPGGTFTLFFGPKRLSAVFYETRRQQYRPRGSAGGDGSQRSTSADLTNAASRVNLNYVPSWRELALLEQIHPMAFVPRFKPLLCEEFFPGESGHEQGELTTRGASGIYQLVAARIAAGALRDAGCPFNHTAPDC